MLRAVGRWKLPAHLWSESHYRKKPVIPCIWHLPGPTIAGKIVAKWVILNENKEEKPEQLPATKEPLVQWPIMAIVRAFSTWATKGRSHQHYP